MTSHSNEGPGNLPVTGSITAAGFPTAEQTPALLKERVIEPTRGWLGLPLRELWEYHELLYFFTLRDIKVRYKQTILGAAWAIIQPFFTMVIFSLVFGRLAKIPSDGIPYPVFSFAALVPWQFFASGLGQAANSLVGNAHMLRKIYFPRMVMPIATILSNLIDFGLAFTVLLGIMLYYGIVLKENIVWLPFFLLLALVTALGTGLWLAVMNVQFRDIRYAVPFIIQFWFFATPITYPSSLLEEPWRTIYGINPMAGVVEGFRWALLGSNTPPGPMTAVSAAAAIFLLVSGLFYFRRMERTFADIV